MADDEAASDIFELRARQVRLAVDVLVLALGGEGATFQRQVQAWLAGLDPRARKLAAFPPALKQAGSRLSGLPAQAARTTFYREVEGLRRNTSQIVRVQPRPPPSRSCTLSSAVRAVATAFHTAFTLRPLVLTTSVVCAFVRAQHFSPPVPACPSGAAELLEALRLWIDEEAVAVRAAFF